MDINLMFKYLDDMENENCCFCGKAKKRKNIILSKEAEKRLFEYIGENEAKEELDKPFYVCDCEQVRNIRTSIKSMSDMIGLKINCLNN